MSFSVETKDELTRMIPKKRCCQLAELSALFRMDGSLQIGGEQKISLAITTESPAVARKIFMLIKELFNIQTEILVRQKKRLKKQNVFQVTVPSRINGKDISQALGLTDEQGILSFEPQGELLKHQCCRRAYLRGAFLGGGSVNSPEGTYHLEIITNNPTHADTICELLKTFDLSAKINERKGWFMVYLKESDQIVKTLSIIGAHRALMAFENVRIVKGMRNQVNRLVNCETANLNKTVNASLRQVECIQMIVQTLGLERLSPPLREMAALRLQYPDASLKELGEMMSPPVGKSGVNHRMRKLEKMADELLNKKPFLGEGRG